MCVQEARDPAFDLSKLPKGGRTSRTGGRGVGAVRGPSGSGTGKDTKKPTEKEGPKKKVRTHTHTHTHTGTYMNKHKSPPA